MNILIFTQPFPMGNYKLNEVIARMLASNYEVAVVEQLNGRPADVEYINQLIEFKPDIIYYEMLDIETFNLIAKYFKRSLKILCCTSLGVLKSVDKILEYKGIYYDKILTNSKYIYDVMVPSVQSAHFKYYLSVIDPIEQLKYKLEYEHECVFLGMGFNRQTSKDYELERNIFFNDATSKLKIYGVGWNDIKNYNGVLPPNDIGNLYYSSNSAISIIAKSQRELGMINNRYTEIINSMCPVISIKYPSVDWFGMDKFINFVDSKDSFNFVVKSFNDDDYRFERVTSAIRYFQDNFNGEFEFKLKKLMELE